jgi:hypothetical protein
MAAPSLVSENTQTATISVEHELVRTTTPGFYELHVDVSAMVGGDTTEIRLKEVVLSGGTENAVGYATYTGAAADPKIKLLGPIAFNRLVVATLKQTAGTGRAYPWKLERVG